MVTFTPAGRFGNFFMECATALAYALRHDLEFTAPTAHGRDPHWNPVYCPDLIHHLYDKTAEEIHLWETKHEYEELPFKEEWRDKNIIIEGYRQSEKYFKDFKNEILYLMGFKWEMNKGVVSIHIRRGDYIHLPQKHILYDIVYMRKATSFFYNKGYSQFKIFSDDIAWCKEEFAKPDFSAFTIEFSSNTNEVDDYIDMSCCEHHINSSSTFSWAAAWSNRNPGKIVVTPELWFQPGWCNLDTKDIIPSEWIKM